MRVMFVAAVAALCAVAVGCGRSRDADDVQQTYSSAVVAPESRVDSVPQEEPAVARSQWRASNDRARSITGNLRVSLEERRGGPVVFAFANGITVRAQPFSVQRADTRSGVGGQSFAAVLEGDPRVDVYLYRVIGREEVTPSAVSGGLCGRDAARSLAVSEFVDGSGRWVFKVAAFKGSVGPEATADPQVCNAFAFVAQ